MTSKLVKQVQSIRSLERAWKAIKANARGSKSEDVKREVEEFSEDASRRIHSLSFRLSRKRFNFLPAKGIPAPKRDQTGKKSRTKFRPIVLAPLESRIVQRCILEILTAHPAMQRYSVTPFSFGGIRKQKGQELAAVPAAVTAVLEAIRSGAKYVASADISGFFTRISKPTVRAIVSDAVKDDEFVSIFDQAIKIELENLSELRERAGAFPIEDIGVAQGNSLSPLLGNIVLNEFDRVMNEGDCRCIRYIDDFIILAPTKAAAVARLRKAIKMLDDLGMKLSPEKSKSPQPISEAFEFLGIEFNNGLIRPNKKSRTRLLAQIKEKLDSSAGEFRKHSDFGGFPKHLSFVDTLRRVDGVVQGWGKHYLFCNDRAVFQQLGETIEDYVAAYIGEYSKARSGVDKSNWFALLGVQKLSWIVLHPFDWPSTKND
jgi:retron-type reverse transcriptase